MSIHGPHGQYVENIHLEPYTSEEEFDSLYHNKYSHLLRKARDFIDATGGAKDDTLVFISCGFDACEHEYESMSRHQRKVPVSFYHRFARDARELADAVANGRLVSVLEGGYSDRALTSGAIAHLSGLAEGGDVRAEPEWWSLESLIALEKATAKRRGGRQSVTRTEPWLERTLEYFAQVNTTAPPAVPPTAMSLRDRSSKSAATAPAAKAPSTRQKAASKPSTKKQSSGTAAGASRSDPERSADEAVSPEATKKLPKVILKLGPQPAA